MISIRDIIRRNLMSKIKVKIKETWTRFMSKNLRYGGNPEARSCEVKTRYCDVL